MKKILDKIWYRIKIFYVEVRLLTLFAIIFLGISIFLASFTKEDWEIYLLLFALISFLFSEEGITSFFEHNLVILDKNSFNKLLNACKVLGRIMIFSLYLSKHIPSIPYERYQCKSQFLDNLLIGSVQFFFATIYTLIIIIIVAIIVSNFINHLTKLNILGPPKNNTSSDKN